MSGYPPDPAMFAQLTREENRILAMHLTSGWYKQAAVYPSLSEPWRETEALLIDLSEAHRGQLPGPALDRPHGTPGQHRRAGTAGTGGRAMTLSISRPEPGARLGADQCPGVDRARPRADHGRHPRRRMLPGVGNRPGSHPRQGRVIPPGRRPVGDGLAGTPPASPRSPRTTAPAKNRRASATPGTPTCNTSAKPHPNPKPRPANPPDGPGTAPGSYTRRPRPLRQNPGRRTAHDQHRRRPAAHQSRS